jgi:hypothetical protein
VLLLLFAVENRVANEFLSDARSRNKQDPPDSPLKKLKEFWKELLPHRDLKTESGSIMVTDPSGKPPYFGKNLSAGERGIIYLLAQVFPLSVCNSPEKREFGAEVKRAVRRMMTGTCIT